jgi:FKBP-type peptidyl-prolyl cis-trans isomerase (trigger factor)
MHINWWSFVDHDEVHTLEVDVDFTIEEINTTELAELNQELFDKLLEKGSSFYWNWKRRLKKMLKLNLQHKQTKIIRRCYWVLNRKHKIRFTYRIS